MFSYNEILILREDLHRSFYSAFISGSLIFDFSRHALGIVLLWRVSSSSFSRRASIVNQFVFSNNENPHINSEVDAKSPSSVSEDYFQAKEHVRFVS